jgi:hypothetical protein
VFSRKITEYENIFMCLFAFCTPTDSLKFSFSRVKRFTIDHNRYLVNYESCNRSFLIAVFGLLSSSLISVRIAQRTQSGSIVRITGGEGGRGVFINVRVYSREVSAVFC